MKMLIAPILSVEFVAAAASKCRFLFTSKCTGIAPAQFCLGVERGVARRLGCSGCSGRGGRAMT